MKPNRPINKTGVVIITIVIAVLMYIVMLPKEMLSIQKLGDTLMDPNFNKPTRKVKGKVLGSMPRPTQPGIHDPVVDLLSTPKTQKMKVKHIPELYVGATRPHPDWGPCIQCHLVPGEKSTETVSPVGKMWAKLSTIKKVGPPIYPDSTRPHPPSGRCIKCHDIVLEIPVQ